jgi:hypothetical protein
MKIEPSGNVKQSTIKETRILRCLDVSLLARRFSSCEQIDGPQVKVEPTIQPALWVESLLYSRHPPEISRYPTKQQAITLANRTRQSRPRASHARYTWHVTRTLLGLPSLVHSNPIDTALFNIQLTSTRHSTIWQSTIRPFNHSTIRFALDTTRKTLHNARSIHPSNFNLPLKFLSISISFGIRSIIILWSTNTNCTARDWRIGLDWIGLNSFVLIMRSEWSYQDSRMNSIQFNSIQFNSIDKVQNRIQFNPSPTSMLSTGVLSIGVASRCSSRFQWWLSRRLFISILTLTVARVEIEAIGPYNLQCLRNQCSRHKNH